MPSVDGELDRVLTLLRNKIREQGFTQLEVQSALEWGRSYISQLLTKQKSLRVEQVLLILEVIDVRPKDFFNELYRFSPAESAEPGAGGQVSSSEDEEAHEVSVVGTSFEQSRELLQGLVDLLVEKRLISSRELESSIAELRGDPPVGPSGR